jgi:putative ABC transport system ATP-binding protein
MHLRLAETPVATEQKPFSESAKQSVADMVLIERVVRSYQMGAETIHALNGIDIQIKPQELIAIIGQSGSGKSTLLNILGCLDSPSQGVYRLDGIDVQDLDDDALAMVRNQFVGFVFQSFQLLPRQSALDNVCLPLVYNRREKTEKEERRARAMASLQRVGLADRADHKPNELSGGQRQRVAIARALINHPKIILADEPTGNLDSRTSAEIIELLVELQREEGATVILVTHEPEVADHCDRQIVLKDGLIIKDELKVRG